MGPLDALSEFVRADVKKMATGEAKTNVEDATDFRDHYFCKMYVPSSLLVLKYKNLAFFIAFFPFFSCVISRIYLLPATRD